MDVSKEGTRASWPPIHALRFSSAKLSSRFTCLLNTDSEEEDSVPIPGPHDDGPSSKSGQSVVPSDYDEPDETDGSFDHDNNEAEQSLPIPVVDDDILLVRNVRWSAARRDGPDDEDSDSDIEDPVEDADNDEDDRYDDWAAIEANVGLSAWDKLGEGFEQEVAGIGMFPSIFS